MLKKCTKCGIKAHTTDELEIFVTGKRNTHGKKNICKSCASIQRKEYYAKTDERERKRRKARENKIHFIQARGGMCEACGEVYDGKNGCIFQFHHIDPTVKEGKPSEMISSSIWKAEEEVGKCLLLCANCHAKEHSEEY